MSPLVVPSNSVLHDNSTRNRTHSFTHISDRLPGIRPRRTSIAATTSDVGEEEVEEAPGQGDAPLAETTAAATAKTSVKRDPGVLAATGATGALAGWCLVHPLGVDLELLGAFSGERVSVVFEESVWAIIARCWPCRLYIVVCRETCCVVCCLWRVHDGWFCSLFLLGEGFGQTILGGSCHTTPFGTRR